MVEDPFVLPQIQRCHHFTQSAIQSLTTFETKNAKLKDVLNALEEVMLSLQQSMEQLRDRENTLPQVYSSSVAQIQQSFHPQLPSDIYMDFSVENYKLRATIKGITYGSSKNKLESIEKTMYFLQFKLTF